MQMRSVFNLANQYTRFERQLLLSVNTRNKTQSAEIRYVSSGNLRVGFDSSKWIVANGFDSNMEFNIGFSTANSTGNPVHRACLVFETVSRLFKQYFSQPGHLISYCEQQLIMDVPSKSTILRSVDVCYTWLCFISEPHLRVQLFPKICV